MSSSWQADRTTVVAGFGSPHGDDQAGWRIATILAQRPDLPARVIVVHEPTQILAALSACQRLIVVDACHSGGIAGAVTHLVWPDERIAVKHCHSTHGVSVADMLKLAERLGYLPQIVEIYGIDVADCTPGCQISRDVLKAIAVVADMVDDALREATYA